MEQTLERNDTTALTENEPLSADEIAAFLDGRLEGEELERVQARLADDPLARQEIIKAGRIISSAPARQEKKPRWIPAIGVLAAAAAIAVVFVQPDNLNRESRRVASERRGTADEPDRVDLLMPAESESLSVAVSQFAWRPIEGATYRIVVSDAAGRTVLQENTTDTLLRIPGALRKAGRYYWSVDALAPDGSSVTSGIHEFVVPSR